MAAFNELLRPERFNAEPSYSQFGKQFKQWFKTLKKFVDSVTSLAQGRNAEPPNKLRSLRAYVSANVYEMIEDCATYDAAIQKLREIYVKLPNVVFARYLLATRKLKPRETLLDFLHAQHQGWAIISADGPHVGRPSPSRAELLDEQKRAQ